VPTLSRLVDRDAAICANMAKAHRLKTILAWFVHLTGWTACRAAEIKPVQGGATAGFEIGLIPHGNPMSHTPRDNASPPAARECAPGRTDVASYRDGRRQGQPHARFRMESRLQRVLSGGPGSAP
jgi:hypothetical protein